VRAGVKGGCRQRTRQQEEQKKKKKKKKNGQKKKKKKKKEKTHSNFQLASTQELPPISKNTA
jgi:hypothetical protein